MTVIMTGAAPPAWEDGRRWSCWLLYRRGLSPGKRGRLAAGSLSPAGGCAMGSWVLLEWGSWRVRNGLCGGCSLCPCTNMTLINSEGDVCKVQIWQVEEDSIEKYSQSYFLLDRISLIPMGMDAHLAGDMCPCHCEAARNSSWARILL